MALVALFILANFSLALSDNNTSQFKPHQSSGKYAGISCKSSSNKAPLQVDGNNEKVSIDGLHAYADWYGLCSPKCCSFNLAIRVSKSGCSPLIMVTDVEVGEECVKDSDCSPGWECKGCQCECVNPSGC